MKSTDSQALGWYGTNVQELLDDFVVCHAEIRRCWQEMARLECKLAKLIDPKQS